MLARTRHPSIVCTLTPEAVPELAASTQAFQDEPFGGLPTLAYGRIFERARSEGVIVLLDGQGMDEQWAGYDYYSTVLDGGVAGLVQGTRDSPVRAHCLEPEFRALNEDFVPPESFPDRLRQVQYRDARYTKIPRALRFNDRISMQYSTELREPFLDHRLFELALRQRPERKLRGGTSKWLLREIARDLLPAGVVEAPKRPVQMPQREWLRGPLKDWAHDHIEVAIASVGGAWLAPGAVREEWSRYLRGESDNSFFVWQWISLGMMIARPCWKRTTSPARPYSELRRTQPSSAGLKP